jgi:cysteine desulfurase
LAAGRIYLDWNATAPVRPSARAAVLAALDVVGNPSSVHREGRAARAMVEAARASVAALVGAPADGVVFTSGGTEANATALARADIDGRPARLLVGAAEHPSLTAAATAADGLVAVDGDGVIDLAALERRVAEAVAAGFAPHLALALAHNETGVVQPVRRAAEILHAAGGRIHVDAVQAAGRMAIGLADLGADTLSLSAHKIGGLAGSGALVSAPGRAPPALIRGGGQEGRHRAGTENCSGIAAFGAAARDAHAGIENYSRLGGLRDWLEAALLPIYSGVTVFGRGSPRVPNTSLFALPGIANETTVMALDLEGIAVSAGAACASGRSEVSPALIASGVPRELARSAIRVSFGWTTEMAAVERLVGAIGRLAERRTGYGRAA